MIDNNCEYVVARHIDGDESYPDDCIGFEFDNNMLRLSLAQTSLSKWNLDRVSRTEQEKELFNLVHYVKKIEHEGYATEEDAYSLRLYHGFIKNYDRLKFLMVAKINHGLDEYKLAQEIVEATLRDHLTMSLKDLWEAFDLCNSGGTVPTLAVNMIGIRRTARETLDSILNSKIEGLYRIKTVEKLIDKVFNIFSKYEENDFIKFVDETWETVMRIKDQPEKAGNG